MQSHTTRHLLARSALLLLPAFCFGQGSLTPPPGAPAATMKTLDQMEPRTPVNATSTPGDATHSFIISQSGSYYLTGNLTAVTGKHGIKITATLVTLDLNGFALTSALAEALVGIEITSTGNVVITNGSLSGWGLRALSGVTAANCRIENLQASSCGAQAPAGTIPYAMEIGEGAIARHCVLSGNARAGLKLGSGSLMEHCNAINNAKAGLLIDHLSRMNSCIATFNGGFGLATNFNCQVSNCSACGNTGRGIWSDLGCQITNCVANENATVGIEVGDRAQIVNCLVRSNNTDGIYAYSDSCIKDCICTANTGAGIHVIGSGSRIEGNTVRDNTAYGILATAGDLILRNNSANPGGVNYTPSSGSNFAPIQSAATQTNPNANH